MRRKESYAVKTATSELSRPVAATYLAIVPLATADSGSALPDLRPSATVALRAPPALSDAPWMQHPFSVESPLLLLDGFPWLSPPERWNVAMPSITGRSRPAAATYHVIVPLAAVDSDSVLPDL